VSEPLETLAEIIDTKLPGHHRAVLMKPLEEAMLATSRRKQIMDLLHEALGQLRLDLKYIMFDLEATRRERDEYKQKLEK